MLLHMRKILFILAAFIFSLSANADNFISGPLCYKPTKPLLFSPDYLKQRHEKETIEYRACIDNYIAEQKRAIQLHKDSITQAEELLKI